MIKEKDLINSLDELSSEILNGQNYCREDYARSILNYPAMMVPAVQEPIIQNLSKAFKGNINLIDPFMGAANTLVTGMMMGLNLYGQDINPLSLLISQVKTHCYSKEELEEARRKILERIQLDKSRKVEVKFSNIDKWFNKEIQIELSKIYRAIQKESKLVLRKFYWVALSEVIRLNSNDRTSTFKLHMRSPEEIASRNLSSIKSFENISNKNIKSISKFSAAILKRGYIKEGQYTGKIDVVCADTKEEIKTERDFQLLVTSPPYGDNHTTVTYGQFSYLPLQWIPLKDIDESIKMDYLCSTQEIDSNSLGGAQKLPKNEIETVLELSKTLKKYVNQFEGIERKRADKVIRFIYDLNLSLDRVLCKMVKNSYLVFTIGNRFVNKKEVNNDLILRELLESKKVKLCTDLKRDILSKRMPNKNNFSNTMSNEKILVFKK